MLISVKWLDQPVERAYVGKDISTYRQIIADYERQYLIVLDAPEVYVTFGDQTAPVKVTNLDTKPEFNMTVIICDSGADQMRSNVSQDRGEKDKSTNFQAITGLIILGIVAIIIILFGLGLFINLLVQLAAHMG